MIASHYGAHFIAEGIGASGIHEAAGRDRDELIGGKRQLGAESRASFGLCGSDEAIATLAFGTPSVQRAHGPNGLPRLRRCDQGNHMAHGTFDAERTGSPEISSRFIAALFLRWVM